MKPAPSTTEYGSGYLLSDEAVEALENLGEVLKPIYLRMKREGYGIVDGEVVKLNENDYEK